MEKLHQLQTKVGAISKDSQNPFYKSSYFDINQLLEVLKPLLNEIGLTIVQPLEIVDGKSVLVTRILDSETGDKIVEGAIILPDNIDPQKMGSAITYYRRYSLQSMLLLQAEDDDANSTVSKPQQAKVSSTIDPLIKCDCGGAVERFEGISTKNNKPYVKLTCQSCSKVNWG